MEDLQVEGLRQNGSIGYLVMVSAAAAAGYRY